MSHEDADNELAIIHLRVAKERKARWVRQSREEGLKLTDWIVGRVERPDRQDAGAKTPPVRK